MAALNGWMLRSTSLDIAQQVVPPLDLQGLLVAVQVVALHCHEVGQREGVLFLEHVQVQQTGFLEVVALFVEHAQRLTHFGVAEEHPVLELVEAVGETFAFVVDRIRVS
jgi:hypothetical protein